MKGEYISIETARIMADIEKENKKLQEENEKLKQKYKNKEYLRDTRTDDYYINIPREKYKTMSDEIILLQDRINKAIEYINSCTWSNGTDEEIQYSLHVPTLLNILQGSDNNE